MLNIITCVYNSFPVAKASIDSIIATTDISYNLFLIDNHSFDSNTRRYLQDLQSKGIENLQILDPGKNLGCHWGWNFGFEHANINFPYTCKIDDDTVMPSNWASKMTLAFENWWLSKKEVIGILGANIDCRTNSYGFIENLNNFQYETPLDIISFSCAMFYTDVVKQIGPMKGMQYRTAFGENILQDEGENLYGGEEVYYLNKVREFGYQAFWLHDVLVHHIDSSKKNWSYLLWKFAYGYLGLTRENYDSFLENEPLLLQAWLILINSRITNPQCSWYGENVEEVVEAFRIFGTERNWQCDLLLQEQEPYRRYLSNKT